MYRCFKVVAEQVYNHIDLDTLDILLDTSNYVLWYVFFISSALPENRTRSLGSSHATLFPSLSLFQSRAHTLFDPPLPPNAS
ncbi:hypothetical protein VNO77_40832 [Canavalia gladiata]|uniref:Uncharacterized protein n=1 Tax=Canavalia gladiata TaxID=3824 RepID=A0AAN9PPT4_CANGL